jgi:hypothetical protein
MGSHESGNAAAAVDPASAGGAVTEAQLALYSRQSAINAQVSRLA